MTMLLSQLVAWLIAPMLNNMPIIQVSGGLLQGVESSDGSYVAYYDVPYATVTDRFKESVPDPKWNGVKKASKKGIECAQRVNATSIKGIEDCLILNVYVPSAVSETPRSVMVFFHGGGYIKGSSSPSMYGPDNFVERDVILVTVNYRLDILGFLCLRTEEAPGNIGLKDQVEALKWINRNIEAFGGYPDNVTIFGQSAGSASVIYHFISPLSQGLYSKAILQSGSPLGYAFIQYDPIFIAHRFAAQLGQDTNNLQELAKILATKSVRELLLTRVPRKIGDQSDSELIFVPCVEKEIPGVDRFLPEYPYTLISEGRYNKVPTIIGFNDEEGYYLTGTLENATTIRNLNFLDALPRDLDFPTVKIKKQIADEANSLYLPNEPISKKNLAKFSRYEGDSTFAAPIAITIDLFLATSNQPIYAYTFTHSGKLNIEKQKSGFGHLPGATHNDELYYLFCNKYVHNVVPERDAGIINKLATLWTNFAKHSGALNKGKRDSGFENLPEATHLDELYYLFGNKNVLKVVSKRDEDIINKLTTLWTNFAKFSNPTPEVSEALPLQWLPADGNKPQVFVIDNDLSTAPLWNERLQFWRSIYFRYRRLG